MGFKTTAFITTAASILLASAPAFAATFTYEKINPLNGNNDAGFNKSITTSYNDNSDLFKWSATFKENNGMLADGAWLVANDGPNPKGHGGESVIYYMDGLAEKVSMFTYSGKNNPNSYQSGTYLGSIDLDVSNSGNERTFSFQRDMTDINNRTDLGKNWKGTAFGDKIGLWHHGVVGVNAGYDTDGKLTSFDFTKQGWYDIHNKDTTRVPEPATAASLGLFAVVGACIKRRKQSA